MPADQTAEWIGRAIVTAAAVPPIIVPTAAG
jgi:hypothetical protein